MKDDEFIELEEEIEEDAEGTKIIDLLKNIKIQMPQSSANQIVLPLVTDNPSTVISDELILSIARDTSYSELALLNESDKPSIAPQGMMYKTKGKGQDRVVLSADVIEPEEEKVLSVGCIQPSEAAHIDKGISDFSFTPAELRVPALKGRESGSYEIIWDDIRKYLREAKVSGNSLREFYDRFDRELEEFIAPFELVKKQIGAIILINNQVAGIELFPNYGTWKQVWRFLLRDSYGADAIKAIKTRKILAYRPYLNPSKINDLADLKEQVEGAVSKFTVDVTNYIDKALKRAVSVSKIREEANFTIYNLSTTGFIGQMIKADNEIVYLSLLRAA